MEFETTMHADVSSFPEISLRFFFFHICGNSLWQQWVQSYGFRPGQAMMLWKRLYGQNIWAHYVDELEGSYLGGMLFIFKFYKICQRAEFFCVPFMSPCIC